jgi:hypothetical protein
MTEEIDCWARMNKLRQYEREKRCEQLCQAKAIHLGKESIPKTDPLFIQDDFYLNPSTTTCCFFCEAENHSQHFCPLKLCTICSKYGHSFRACKRFKRHRNKHNSAGAPRSSFFRSFLLHC